MLLFVRWASVLLVLHAGHQSVSFQVYLSRLLVILLGFVVLAIAIDSCLDAVGHRYILSVTARDGEEEDR